MAASALSSEEVHSVESAPAAGLDTGWRGAILPHTRLSLKGDERGSHRPRTSKGHCGGNRSTDGEGAETAAHARMSTDCTHAPHTPQPQPLPHLQRHRGFLVCRWWSSTVGASEQRTSTRRDPLLGQPRRHPGRTCRLAGGRVLPVRLCRFCGFRLQTAHRLFFVCNRQ